MINRIQNKSFVYIIYMCTSYIYYVYKYTHIHVYISEKHVMFYVLNVFIYNINIYCMCVLYIHNKCTQYTYICDPGLQ